ncbi:MAG TPA: class I SAM-dependent methyltransferase [Thermoanaerobaculia bacterium]
MNPLQDLALHPVLATVQLAADEFLHMASGTTRFDEEAAYHRVLSSVHAICAAIVDCENAGLTRAEIIEVLEPVRAVHRRSPFVERLQTWPEGYPGDFRTIEYLCRGTNAAPEGTVEYHCEQYALTRAIAQQHRNKVHLQAMRILQTMLEKPGASRILSIACGSCPDLRLLPNLDSIAGEIWLNDADDNALAFARARLASVDSRLRLVRGMVPRSTMKLREQFDLVVAGGLFDYLSERQAIFLIRDILNRLLVPGGSFYFTNIAEGNPYRPLIEYLGDWRLLERSEDEMLRYCEAAGASREQVHISRDATNLALIIEVTATDR